MPPLPGPLLLRPALRHLSPQRREHKSGEGKTYQRLRRLPQRMGGADGWRGCGPVPAGHGAPPADAKSLEPVLSPQRGAGMQGHLFFQVLLSSQAPKPPDPTARARGDTTAQQPPRLRREHNNQLCLTASSCKAAGRERQEGKSTCPLPSWLVPPCERKGFARTGVKKKPHRVPGR